MKRELIGRFIAAVLIGMLFGSYIHHDYVKWSQRGREAFIAYQTHRFDRFMLSPHPAIATVFTFTFLMVIFLGIYELLAAVLLRMIGSTELHSGNA